MGNRRMGLGRMEALLEQVDRDLNLENSTLTNCTITTTASVKIASLQAVTNGADLAISQFDGTEVARIHDGAVVPTAAA